MVFFLLVFLSSGSIAVDEENLYDPLKESFPLREKTPQELVTEKLKRIEKESRGKLGVYVLNTESHTRLSYHAETRFRFCSTFKLIVVAAILKSSEEQTGLLQERIYYTQQDVDRAAYSPITEQYIDKGMTVAELCRAAIQHSDNAAANLLIKKLGLYEELSGVGTI